MRKEEKDTLQLKRKKTHHHQTRSGFLLFFPSIPLELYVVHIFTQYPYGKHQESSFQK